MSLSFVIEVLGVAELDATMPAVLVLGVSRRARRRNLPGFTRNLDDRPLISGFGNASWNGLSDRN
jgi:hypothetical protein